MEMLKSPEIDIKSRLLESARAVEDVLVETLENCRFQDRLLEAVRYSLLDGGKRLRGVLVLWCCEIVSGKVTENARLGAAAVEMVHCYSLIHDDLPAMDDDDLRRGKPSSHKSFDEATAILAGDSLLTYTFEVLTLVRPEITAIKMIQTLTQAAGPAGMVAGQMSDIQAENQTPDFETLEYIHTNKTAKMFEASAVLGALAGGASDAQLSALSDFGLKLGLCFQISDDILDVSATDQAMGKTTGKDAQQGKMTYPALMGLEKAKKTERMLAEEAVENLEVFGSDAKILRDLVNYLLKRKN